MHLYIIIFPTLSPAGTHDRREEFPVKLQMMCCSSQGVGFQMVFIMREFGKMLKQKKYIRNTFINFMMITFFL